MKTILAIVLVMLVYVCGFYGCASANPPRMAPTVPMAPGVKNPGATNANNPDVPHPGDHLVAAGEDEDGELYFAVPSSIQDDPDGAKSMVLLVVYPMGDGEHPDRHRIAGRGHFKCAEGVHQSGVSYILDDSNNIVETRPAEDWKPTREGTVAESFAAIACGFVKPAPGQQSTRTKKPGVVEL